MNKGVFILLTCLATAIQAFADDHCYQTCTNCLGFDSAISIDVGGGYRNDNFKWSTTQTLDTPQIHSVLNEKWKNIGMGIIETNAQLLANEHWLFKVDFDYGWFDKVNQQKVKGVDFRNLTAIEATSKVKGSVYDISGALGYQFDLDSYRLSLAPLAGWSYSRQHFKNNHYFDYLTNEQFYAHNEYQFSWNGPWIGVAAAYQVCSEWQFYVDYAFHWAHFKAQYQDAFLNTFDQQYMSAKAHARSNNAHGNEVTVGTTYQFCENWFLGFKFNYKDFWADKASSKLKHSVETVPDHEKNIRWNSYFATVDIGYTF